MTADYLCQCELHAPDSLHLRVSAPDGQEARLTSRVTLDPQQADLRRLVKQARHGQGTLRGWQELGEALYAGLFDPAAQAHLTNWRQRAADAGGRLHLQLEVDAQLPELNALPWEFLRQPATAGRPALWLAAEPAFTLTRRRLLETITISPQAPGPLDILVAIAAPADQGQVEYQPVVDQLLALAQKQPRRLAAPRVLNPASLESARRALAARPPQLFHFIGHGRLRAGGLGEIALVGPDGRLAQWVPDETFSALFNRPEIGCVILQACEGAASAAGRPLTGVAAQVAQRNIPLVLAFQFPISNHAALAFFKVFYEELLAGQAVAAAVHQQRGGGGVAHHVHGGNAGTREGCAALGHSYPLRTLSKRCPHFGLWTA